MDLLPTWWHATVVEIRSSSWRSGTGLLDLSPPPFDSRENSPSTFFVKKILRKVYANVNRRRIFWSFAYKKLDVEPTFFTPKNSFSERFCFFLVECECGISYFMLWQQKSKKIPRHISLLFRFLLIPIARYHLFWEYHRRTRGRSPISPIPRPIPPPPPTQKKMWLYLFPFFVWARFTSIRRRGRRKRQGAYQRKPLPLNLKADILKDTYPLSPRIDKKPFLPLSYFRILPNNPTVAEQLSPPQNKNDDHCPQIDSLKKEGKWNQWLQIRGNKNNYKSVGLFYYGWIRRWKNSTKMTKTSDEISSFLRRGRTRRKSTKLYLKTQTSWEKKSFFLAKSWFSLLDRKWGENGQKPSFPSSFSPSPPLITLPSPPSSRII